MKLLFLGPEENVADVKSFLPGFEVMWAITEKNVESALPQVDAILDAYMKVRFPESRLKLAPQLKLVVCATTGSDHIDATYLKTRNVPILSLQGQKEVLRNLTPAAEHSWLLLMACARQLKAAFQEVDRKEWDRNKFPGLMLKGKTLGLVGCGRIGQWMSRYATAFGMTVVGFDPFLTEWPQTIRPLPLEEVIKISDFVSVHVPLSDKTKKLLGAKEFAAMKKGVVVINTSRGDIIDEDALLKGLEKGHIAAAGLDVITGEPDIKNHPLVRFADTHPQLMITPHIAGFSPEALLHVLRFCADRVKTFFSEGTHGPKSESAGRSTR